MVNFRDETENKILPECTDSSVQCVQECTESSVQCAPVYTESSVQYDRPEYINSSVQAELTLNTNVQQITNIERAEAIRQNNTAETREETSNDNLDIEDIENNDVEEHANDDSLNNSTETNVVIDENKISNDKVGTYPFNDLAKYMYLESRNFCMLRIVSPASFSFKLRIRGRSCTYTKGNKKF